MEFPTPKISILHGYGIQVGAGIEAVGSRTIELAASSRLEKYSMQPDGSVETWKGGVKLSQKLGKGQFKLT